EFQYSGEPGASEHHFYGAPAIPGSGPQPKCFIHCIYDGHDKYSNGHVAVDTRARRHSRLTINSGAVDANAVLLRTLVPWVVSFLSLIYGRDGDRDGESCCFVEPISQAGSATSVAFAAYPGQYVQHRAGGELYDDSNRREHFSCVDEHERLPGSPYQHRRSIGYRHVRAVCLRC